LLTAAHHLDTACLAGRYHRHALYCCAAYAARFYAPSRLTAHYAPSLRFSCFLHLPDCTFCTVTGRSYTACPLHTLPSYCRCHLPLCAHTAFSTRHTPIPDATCRTYSATTCLPAFIYTPGLTSATCARARGLWVPATGLPPVYLRIRCRLFYAHLFCTPFLHSGFCLCRLTAHPRLAAPAFTTTLLPAAPLPGLHTRRQQPLRLVCLPLSPPTSAWYVRFRWFAYLHTLDVHRAAIFCTALPPHCLPPRMDPATCLHFHYHAMPSCLPHVAPGAHFTLPRTDYLPPATYRYLPAMRYATAYGLHTPHTHRISTFRYCLPCLPAALRHAYLDGTCACLVVDGNTTAPAFYWLYHGYLLPLRARRCLPEPLHAASFPHGQPGCATGAYGSCLPHHQRLLPAGSFCYTAGLLPHSTAPPLFYRCSAIKPAPHCHCHRCRACCTLLQRAAGSGSTPRATV